jgi:hypothetical protein
VARHVAAQNPQRQVEQIGDGHADHQHDHGRAQCLGIALADHAIEDRHHE